MTFFWFLFSATAALNVLLWWYFLALYFFGG